MAGFLGAKGNTRDFRVRKKVDGIRHARPAVPVRFRPITLQMLRVLILSFGKLCRSELEAYLIKAVVLVMFWGAF